MRDLLDFLVKLDKLTFVSAKGNTLTTVEGFEVSYELKLMSSLTERYPVQFIFRVFKNNVYVTSWGCDSNEANAVATKWFLNKKYYSETSEYDAEVAVKESYKEIFNNL